jgi:glucose-1-phosphate thymidylyltransferase
MKALILAGGTGSRLRPITHTSAKQLIPVANKPILYYGLEAISEAGISEVGIVVGETAAEVIEAVGDGSRWGLDVTYIPQDAPLGLAHAVKIAQDFIGEDRFVMYLGDNLIKGGIAALVGEFESAGPDCEILLARVPHPERFGVAELAGDTVVRLIEKPSDPPSDLALVGVYLFTSCIFDAVGAIEPSARGELEITDAIQKLIDTGHTVMPHVIDGWWKDTGKLDDLLEANRIMLADIERRIEGSVDGESRLEGKVVLERGATVVRSTIVGPAVIGAGTHIEEASIGPFTSIHENCRIVSSEVEHSILLPFCEIVGLAPGPRLTDSLLGRHAIVRRSKTSPGATRLMVGDNSDVEIG